MTDPFLNAAIAEAEAGLAEGGIPIGSVLVHDGKIVGRGHNRRIQRGSAILHGEMDALENAGRLPAAVYLPAPPPLSIASRSSTRHSPPAPCAAAPSFSTASRTSSSPRTRPSSAKRPYS